MFRGTAPAKIILFGEHAVVYGQPAIAAPVNSLFAEAIASPINSPFHLIALDLESQQIPLTAEHSLALAARLTFNALELSPPQASIQIRSTIPLASGLGSGAAISAAIVRSICSLMEQRLSDEQINEIVYEVEKIYHGTPSGIDNTVIVYNQVVYFVRGEPIQHLQVKRPLRLLIADTGRKALTKIAVGDVRKLVEANPGKYTSIIEQIGTIAKQAQAAMSSGELDRLGILMDENHCLLDQLTVSSPELETLVNAARQAGAAGAKLSGGGRGGNMIALCTEETKSSVRSALEQAGAQRIIETTIAATEE
ncbi:MAG: mevalonate kinase [Anaerolineae bacterium]|nr:mevalonate kinase [Anaerolineae bacterium]